MSERHLFLVDRGDIVQTPEHQGNLLVGLINALLIMVAVVGFVVGAIYAAAWVMA